MHPKYLLPALLLLTGLTACRNQFYKAKSEYQIASVNNNVCKKLFGKVVLYAIFVDTRETRPWTAYDINTTLDSIRKAASWITGKAKENNADVTVEIKYHQRSNVIPLDQNLYEETLSQTLVKPNLKEGIDNLDDWADALARKAGSAFPPDSSPAAKTKIRITDRERLIARLRDLHSTDNVVLMYFLNNYYQREMSLALHTSSQNKTEYAIVSFKNPAVIAHEFLHIFGALDLYMSPFDRKRKTLKHKLKIMNTYPDEIMAFTERPVEKLTISPMTAYFVGWAPQLSQKDKDLLFGKKLKITRY